MTPEIVPHFKKVKTTLILAHVIALAFVLTLLGFYVQDLATANTKINEKYPDHKLERVYQSVLRVTLVAVAILITVAFIGLLGVIKERKYLVIISFVLLCIVGFFIACGLYDLARFKAYEFEDEDEIHTVVSLQKISVIKLIFSAMTLAYWIITLISVINEKRLLLCLHLAVLNFTIIIKLILLWVTVYGEFLWSDALYQLGIACALALCSALVVVYMRLIGKKLESDLNINYKISNNNNNNI